MLAGHLSVALPRVPAAISLPTGGEHKGAWDSGRYSESRVWWHNGLWHLFATASADGGTAAHPNGDKVNEQIGWMISNDGMNFTEVSL